MGVRSAQLVTAAGSSNYGDRSELFWYRGTGPGCNQTVVGRVPSVDLSYIPNQMTSLKSAHRPAPPMISRPHDDLIATISYQGSL